MVMRLLRLREAIDDINPKRKTPLQVSLSLLSQMQTYQDCHKRLHPYTLLEYACKLHEPIKPFEAITVRLEESNQSTFSTVIPSPLQAEDSPF
ncbi:hypothetical protein Plhal304r1_c028g0093871 [Plasmopara halstedii]